MMHSVPRIPRLQWNALGKLAAMIAVAAMVGFTAASPARADYDGHHGSERGWRGRHEEWREHRGPRGFGFYYSNPSYGYYSYPSYGYYPYSYYGYYPYGSSDYGYDYSR